MNQAAIDKVRTEVWQRVPASIRKEKKAVKDTAFTDQTNL